MGFLTKFLTTFYILLPAALVTSVTTMFPCYTRALETKDLPARSLEEEVKDNSGSLQQKLGSQVPDAILNISTNPFFSNYVFLIDKTDRSLTIWQKSADSTKAIRNYPTDIGKNQGDKTSLGDHKTPEGIYTFQEMFEGPNLDFSLYGSRAYTISYPNLFDNLLGKTGSGIWLHAVPDTVALTRGSRGCVVVRNGVIKELSQFINLKKTPIIIRDAVQYVAPELQKKKYQDIAAKIEDWRLAWERKDVNKYIDYYSESFAALGMNKKQWRKYKEELSVKYKEIKIKFSEPSIFEQKNQITVRTLQSYESNEHSDFGEKTIYLTYDGTNISIVGEEWTETKDPGVIQGFNSSLFSLKPSTN